MYHNTMSNQKHICIIGAGVAGGTLAAYLADKGVPVTVIERNLNEQDRIVGELLQPGGVEQLKRMNLEHFITNIDAAPVTGYALFKDNESFKIEYPEYENHKVIGYGFRNGKFVQNIRKYLLNHPNVKIITGRALSFIEHNNQVDGIVYENEAGESFNLQADLTIACDGSASKFREVISKNNLKVNGYFVGIVLKNTELPYNQHGHVIVADPAPVLVYPISSTETRVLIDFPGEKAPRKDADLRLFLLEKILPQMPKEISVAFENAVNSGDIKMMPNCYMPAKPIQKHGAVLLGDSLNMRHPLTGGGMTVAFTDVQRLGDHLIDAYTKEANFSNAVQLFYDDRHKNTATINILADALYGVIRNPNLANATFSYLKKGGKNAEEPVAILSAISRNFNLLMRHFFSVAIHGIRTSPKFSFKNSYKMLGDAVRIVHPLVMSEKPDPFTKMALQIARKMF